jgi:hypothetical protein
MDSGHRFDLELLQAIGRLEAERDALQRWQSEARPYLIEWERREQPHPLSIRGSMVNRLIAEAEGTGTT